MTLDNVPVTGIYAADSTDWTSAAIFLITFLLFLPAWLAYGNLLKLSKLIRRVILLLGTPVAFVFGLWVLSFFPDNVDTVDLDEFLNEADSSYHVENVKVEGGGSVVDLPYSGRTKTYNFTFTASPRGEEERCKGNVRFERKNERTGRTNNVYASVRAMCPSDGE
ncbi:hypothetical protein ACUY3L_06550 [Corynebacterium mastitidis]